MQVLNKFIKAAHIQFEKTTLHVYIDCQCHLYYDEDVNYKEVLKKDMEEFGFKKIHVHVRKTRPQVETKKDDRTRMMGRNSFQCEWTPEWEFIEWSYN